MFVDAPIISNGEIQSSQLKTLILNNFLLLAECSRTYGSLITASHICLSGSNTRSTCPGDSGGPLTVKNSGRDVQVGIVSFGSEVGCQRNYPTAFTRLTSFYTWIQSNTGITIA